MIRLINMIFTIMMLMFAGKSYAALIEYNGYTLDESTNIVTDGELEWLQWDVTRGMSIDTAVADIADGNINGVDYGFGWSLASNVQMAAMFNIFGFGADFEWDNEEQTEQFLLDPTANNDGAIEDINSDPELQFTALFGETWLSPLTDPANPFRISRAIFGQDLDGDSLYNRAEVYDDYQVETGVISGNAWLRLDATETSFEWMEAGIALVRVTDPKSPNHPIGEPSLLALFAIGLGMMMRLRSRNLGFKLATNH